jgi:hypothetical protein
MNAYDLAIRGSLASLDSRKTAFDPRPVALDVLAGDGVDVAVPRRGVAQGGHEILRAGEDEDVGVGRVVVPRKPLVRLPRDLWDGKVPSHAERTISSTGVVREGQLGVKAAPARAGGQGDLERGGTRHRVGGELLADPPDRAASLGERRDGHARS